MTLLEPLDRWYSCDEACALARRVLYRNRIDSIEELGACLIGIPNRPSDDFSAWVVGVTLNQLVLRQFSDKLQYRITTDAAHPEQVRVEIVVVEPFTLSQGGCE